MDLISLADFLAGVAYWSKQDKELSRDTILYNVDTKDKVNSEAVVLARDYSSVWDHFVFSMVDYVRNTQPNFFALHKRGGEG